MTDGRRFVVTQQMGVPEDAAWLRGGLVEVDADAVDGDGALAETLRYYLGAPGLREAIAGRGYELLRSRRQSALLRDGVEELLTSVAADQYCLK